MTQAIGSYSNSSNYYRPSLRSQSNDGQPAAVNSMPTGGGYGYDPYGDQGGAGYYPYAGSSYYGGYPGSTNNPQLNQILDLGPLTNDVYSGFNGDQYVGTGYSPYNADGSPNGPPPPPSYIGDSPAGFAANVIDPYMATATATYSQTKNMLDDYDQAHPDGNGD